MPGKTGAQYTGYVSMLVMGVLPVSPPASYSTYRRIRKHPTIALARKLSMAPILRAKWGIEGPDARDEVVEMAGEVIGRLRSPFLRHILPNLYDYGFSGMEQYQTEGNVPQLKGLLSEGIQVLVDSSGNFLGLRVSNLSSALPTDLGVRESVFLGMDAEAGSFYGTGYLEIARSSHSAWEDVAGVASRYDLKVAGSHLVLYYPPGKSIDGMGVEKENSILAGELLGVLESSGSAAIQDESPQYLESLNKTLPPRWHVEYISDPSPRQTSFIERMRYLDVLLVRSFGLPERAVLEGEFGTKAEAVAHQNLAMQVMESLHDLLTEEFDRQVLSPHLALMFGREPASRVWISAGPISNEGMIYSREVAGRILEKDPSSLDLDALLDEIGLPKKETITGVK